MFMLQWLPQSHCVRLFVCLVGVLGPLFAQAGEHSRASREDLWALQPLPLGRQDSREVDENPIDRILSENQSEMGVVPFPRADRETLLRRVTFDLIGLPPTLEDQDAFLTDLSSSAYESLIDRLLANPQHGVRYARHWLDVLRYADVDEGMPAGSGLYLWREWVIRALNRNLPYDAFVRTQITGLGDRERSSINALGYRNRKKPKPDDLFALGFLARGATSRANSDHTLAIAAVETSSTAFLGLTLACAKCHDHFYDPISQEDFYRMKALFDPLVLREIPLATAKQIQTYGDELRHYETAKAEVDAAIAELEGPYRERLFEERVEKLPATVQAIIRKVPQARTAEEQKIADDYFPVLRIDVGKIREVMPDPVLKEYDRVRKRLSQLSKPKSLPSFLTVEEDAKRREAVRYVLNSGEASRPEVDRVVQPGFVFEPQGTDYREGLRETFVDWLTSRENALFARVVVNRIWQWHFGKGLHKNASDFGSLSGEPALRRLIDTLAVEFVENDFNMKWLHKRILMSQAYQRASAASDGEWKANRHLDPANESYWRFPLRRLEAEPIHDALLLLADRLDLSLGGESYSSDPKLEHNQRRAIYLKRGFRSREELLPEFLDAFDAEDGRESCARRTVTVTAPQALWLMNNPMVQAAATAFGARLRESAKGDNLEAIKLAYRMALGRAAHPEEIQICLDAMFEREAPFESLAWMLFNLDEFVYIR